MKEFSAIEIRNTVMEDLPHIQEWLMDREVLKGFPMIDQREVEDSIRFWQGYIEEKTSITAVDKKEPVGCANLYISPISKLKHQCLFVIIVKKACRGKGVGTFLLHSLEKLAKETFHIELIHLEVYENNPAINLYKRMGFNEYGRHPHYLKEPDGTYYDKIMMQKFLQ
jgi:ribosomal protein S18 acetylase RimI-like enzyme